MYRELREQCYELNMQLADSGLIKQTFGNVSIADRVRGVMAIKPSGVKYSELKAADIPVLSLDDGRPVEGAARPSSDTPTHLVLYRAFPNIGGVVHTHSTFATAWAQAACDVPLYGTTHADSMSVPIPCTDFMEDERIKGDYRSKPAIRSSILSPGGNWIRPKCRWCWWPDTGLSPGAKPARPRWTMRSYWKNSARWRI